MAQYTYDEQGFNFYYFLISVLSLCLVPVSIKTFYTFYKTGGKVHLLFFFLTLFSVSHLFFLNKCSWKEYRYLSMSNVSKRTKERDGCKA